MMHLLKSLLLRQILPEFLWNFVGLRICLWSDCLECFPLHTRNRISNFIHSSWDMHCIDISRTKDITLSDLELLIFSIWTTAWLSQLNLMRIPVNWNFHQKIARKIGTSSRNVISLKISVFDHSFGHCKNTLSLQSIHHHQGLHLLYCLYTTQGHHY